MFRKNNLVLARLPRIPVSANSNQNYRPYKRKFYSAFNAIMGKIGRLASEEVTLSLISAKCIPCLLYATEAMPFNSSQLKSLNFPVKRVLFKLFKTTSSDIINECQYMSSIFQILRT